jgi:hypothetical protein
MKICKKCGIEKSESEFKKATSWNCNNCRNLSYENQKSMIIKNYHENKSDIKLRQKTYRDNNKEKIKYRGEKYTETHQEYIKKYRSDRKDKYRKYNQEYNLKNKERLGEKRKEYNLENKEKMKERNKKYYANNKNLFKENRKIYCDQKRKSDPLFKLSESIRNLIKNGLLYRGIKKKIKTEKILGCSFKEFKLHIESKFEPWMTWENRGLYNGELNYGWDIDHIIPLSLSLIHI